MEKEQQEIKAQIEEEKKNHKDLENQFQEMEPSKLEKQFEELTSIAKSKETQINQKIR